MIEISHDAFGRFSVYSKKTDAKNPCPNCGQVSKFIYGVEKDGRPGRIDWQEKAFCSIGCMREYYR
jgi:hypothetical protein